jgi:hypothetical protein
VPRGLIRVVLPFRFAIPIGGEIAHIATIAMSGGYSADEIPVGILADAFLQKENYTVKELSPQVGKLLAVSPIRAEKKKSEIAPLFVPRDRAEYLMITCPKCLRPNKLQAMSLNGGLHAHDLPVIALVRGRHELVRNLDAQGARPRQAGQICTIGDVAIRRFIRLSEPVEAS